MKNLGYFLKIILVTNICCMPIYAASSADFIYLTVPDEIWKEYGHKMLSLGKLPKLLRVLNNHQSQLSKQVYLETIHAIHKVLANKPVTAADCLPKLAALDIPLNRDAFCTKALKEQENQEDLYPSVICSFKLDDFYKILLFEQSKPKQVALIVPYDKTLYELGYSVFVQSGNIKRAYVLALAASQQNPDDPIWRERLIQTAFWNGKLETVLSSYLYLFQHKGDQEAGIKGEKLARKIQNDEFLAQFLYRRIELGNQSDRMWTEYSTLMLRLGEITKLIEILNANQNQMSKILYLSIFKRIYRVLDDPLNQLAILNRIKALQGLQPDTAQAMADIYISKGKVEEADSRMRQATDSHFKKTDKFWLAYFKSSYIANQPSQEFEASLHLIQKEKPPLSVMSRIVELAAIEDPNEAYLFAQRGADLYPNSFSMAVNVFNYMKQHQSLDFPLFMANFSPKIRKLLRYESSFWEAQVNYWRRVGNTGKVMETFVNGMHYLTTNDSFKSEFINFLMEIMKHDLLRNFMNLWQRDLPQRPYLWHSYAEANVRLSNRMMARLVLNLFYEHFKEYERNPYWLIHFKDSLENAYFEREGKNVSYYAWPYLIALLNRQESPPDYSQKVNYVKLSLSNASGDPTAFALHELQNYENEEVELLMLTWAMNKQNISLAKAIYSHFKQKGINAPLWAPLSIALVRNDKEGMKKIIKAKRLIPNYTDHISAARAINALPLAQTLAYNSLKQHRKDHQLYDDFFTPIMLEGSDNAYISEEYYQYADVVGPRTIASLTYFLKPSLSITPYNSIWFMRLIPSQVPQGSNDAPSNFNQILATVPSRDEQAGIKIKSLARRGRWLYDLGIRKELTSFFTGEIKRTYTVWSDLELEGTLGYHVLADDTESLYVGGMKNTLELDANYHLLKNDNVLGNYKQKVFYTQNGQYLAQGIQATLHYQHKFWQTYPDWTLTPYATIAHYYQKTNNLIYGSAQSLVPPTLIPNANFFIPQNFNEFGAALSFGQSLIDDYTHRWRPLASLSIGYNSVIGLTKLINIGLAGTVFGKDHLLLYYEWGSNQGQGIQILQLAKLSYRIYF